MTGTERKVFQKYYPPDFDPNKLTKKGGGGRKGPRQFVQRVMAPFNMQCNTCHEYIYKGKKFNMRRETAEGEEYLGLKIFRFYFRCPNCLAEIVFKTDMEHVDYAMEHGATRLFEAFKFYQEKQRELEAKEEQEKHDPMKVLEKRTQMSKEEMEAMSKLEELQELNRRHKKIDPLSCLEHKDQSLRLTQAERLKLQEEEDEAEVQRLMAQKTVRVTETVEEVDDQPCSSSNYKPQWKKDPAKKKNESSLFAGLVRKRPKVDGPAVASTSVFVSPHETPHTASFGPSATNGVKLARPIVNLGSCSKPTGSLLGLDYGSGSDSD